MVKIDFKKVHEQRKREHEAHLEAIARCEASLDAGGEHVGRQVRTNCVDVSAWRREYKCTSCGWLYDVKMTPKEIRDYKKEMDRVRIVAG